MLVREDVKIDEDRLTHAVVGLMRYLPPELWFRLFIQELRRRNLTALRILDTAYNPKIQLWPVYLIPDGWKHAFWRPQPKKGDPEVPKGSICPDALIATDNWIMVVESEYSHDLEAEQLFQQFAIASRERQDKEFFVLLINRALTRPSHCGVDSFNLKKPEAGIRPEDSLEKYISACCNRSLGLMFTEDDVKQRLLWLNWQSLYKLFVNLPLGDEARFITLPNSFQRMVKVMCDDVCGLLESEDLVPISFDVIDRLTSLSITPGLVSSLPVIIPITQILNQLAIHTEVIPQWHNHPEISKILETFNLWPECIPEPLFTNQS